MVTSTTITRIGNSKGIRIPALILEALNLKEYDFVKKCMKMVMTS